MKILLILSLLAQANPKAEAELKKAEALLAEKPDDARANQTVGLYHFQFGDPEKAIAYLAKGSEKTLKEAAETEGKADPSNAVALVDLGDLWVKAMVKNKHLRQPCFDRANHWYGKAWPDLDEPGKLKLKAKLDLLYRPIVQPRNGPPPQGWGKPIDPDTKLEVVGDRVRSGGGALRVTSNGRGGIIVTAKASVNIPKGKKLVFEGWTSSRDTDGTGDTLVINFLNFDLKPLGGKRWRIPPDMPVWTRVGGEVDVPEGASVLQFEIYTTSSKGAYWLDDLSFLLDGKETIKGGTFE